MLVFSFVFSIISLSSFVNFSFAFKTTKIRSASSIRERLLFTPIFSTLSSVFLIPAVSIILSAIPSKEIFPSTISLVVPSISVTIAFSYSKRLFKMLL